MSGPVRGPQFASGERHFLGSEENPMMRHDSLCRRARAFMNVRVCLLAMFFGMIWAVALAAPSAVAQSTTPQYLFVADGDEIKTFIVDTTTGALTPITPAPVLTPSPAVSLSHQQRGHVPICSRNELRRPRCRGIVHCGQ